MPRYIDLDDLIPQDITVRIGGEEFLLPGDVPVPDYLELQRLSAGIVDGDTDDPEGTVVALHDRLLDLFRVHQPDMDVLPVGPRALLPLVFRYLDAPMDSPVEEAPARPTRRGGTPTKSNGSPPRTRTTERTTTKSRGSGSST